MGGGGGIGESWGEPGPGLTINKVSSIAAPLATRGEVAPINKLPRLTLPARLEL